MKKLLLSLVLIAGFTLSMQAQFGIRGGMNISTLSLSNDTLSIEPSSRIGINIGAVYTYAFTDQFSIRPGFLYSQKGAKVKGATSDETVTMAIDYLEMPIDLVYYFGADGGFSFTGGLYLGLLLKSDLNGVDKKEDTEALDMGLNFGLAYDINKFTIGATYGFGFTNMGRKLFITDLKGRNIQIYGIYSF